MKKFKKVLLSLSLACLCSISCAVFSSCGKEGKGKISISYNTMGAAEMSDVKVEIGKNYTLPVPQDREGYRFVGWYTTETFDGEKVTEIVASSNQTYYAKWVQVFAVNLDLNGGSLNVDKVYLAAGENVYEALKDYVPKKDNLTFGAWFKGTQELSKAYTMKSEALTLKAEYKVAYTVNVYLEKLDGTGYEDPVSTVGSEYVGKSFTSKHTQAGFKDVSDQTTLQKTLSANPAENVFNHYFERNTYIVTLNVNDPNSAIDETETIEGKYGEKIPLPSDSSKFVSEGYCFLGWKTSKTSKKIDYAADLTVLLHGNTQPSDKKLEHTIEKTATLYGVWQKGYVDMFGGDDYIYYLEESEEVYLNRGNVYFKGEYDAEENEFYFENGIEGKFFNDEKFLYYDTSSDRMKTCHLFVSGEGIVSTTVIRLKKDNSLTYHVYDEAGKEIEYSEGVYEILDNGEYAASFTDGDEKGGKLNFLVGVAQNEDGGTQPVFQVRNNAEVKLGAILSTGIIKNDSTGYYVIGYGAQSITLDGFGTATLTLTSSGQTETYKYRFDGEKTLVLTDANGKELATMIVYNIPNSQSKGYMPYQANLDGEFTIGENETLTLNGSYQAVYKNGEETVDSYYTSYTTPMGNTLVSIIDSKKAERKFLLTPYTEFDEESGEDVVRYTVKRVLNTYAEYYYMDAESIYYAPMLVVDESEEGKATLYGYTAKKTYVKVSEGTYTLGSEGLFVFTVDPDSIVTDTDAYTDPIDLETVESFVFAVDTEHTNYSVHFWYSYNNGQTEYEIDLANTDIESEATLKLVGGFAFYKPTEEADAIIGSYTVNESILTFTAEEKTYCFSVDLTAKKFTVLQYKPYQANRLGSDNKISLNVYLDFDGLGGAVYTQKGVDGASDTLISGTITEVKKEGTTVETLFGNIVYQFTPTAAEHADKAFQYILVKEGDRVVYATLQGEFESGTYQNASTSTLTGELTIDGYCYKAKFVSDDTTYEGMYYVEGNSILLWVNGEIMYFDFDGETFTVRGEEYGTYALFENRHNDNLFVELDGYGTFTMFSWELKDGSTDEYVRHTIIEKSNYTIENEVFTFTVDSKQISCVKSELLYEDQQGNVYYGLSMEQELKTSLFVHTGDWSVLILDEYGNATKYDEKGRRQIGQYTLITAPEDGDAPNTEYLLYFINNQRTSACLYSYNVTTNEATPIVLEAKSYYTEDLRSLYFSKEGVAIFNGNRQEENYYVYEGNNVVIYRRAKDGEDANSCGFVRDTEFGELKETKVYDGKTYYRNYGTDLSFKRAETEVKKYPIVLGDTKLYLKDLVFAPSGGAEFNVSCLAVFDKETEKGGETATEELKAVCTITRELVDGEMKMYVTYGGVYRYYITATYQGGTAQQANAYQVQGLSYVQTLVSYRYLDVLFRIYYNYGAASANAYKNDFGTLNINVTYNEDGSINTSLMQATFGEASEVYDQNGDLLTFEDAYFEFTANGGMAEFSIQDEGKESATKYRLYFAVQAHQYLNAQGYFIISLVRIQTLENNGYEVMVGRTLVTEASGIEVGGVFIVGVYKDEVLVQAEEFYESNGSLVYVERVRDEDGYVTAANYYTITLEENESEGGSVQEGVVATYKSVTITKAEATIVCEKDPTDPNETYKGKDRYVEIVDGEIKFLQLVANKRYAKSCTFENGIYTVETTDGRTYYVKYTSDNQNVIITDDISELA